MSIIVPTITELLHPGEGEAYAVVWAGMATGDTGTPVSLFGFTDRSVQVEGTFGGGTLTMQASLDGTNYEGLRDPSSTALTFAAGGLKGILEAAINVRPSLAGGAASGITVTMLCMRTRR